MQDHEREEREARVSETPKPRACYMRHGKVYDAQLKYVNATPAVAITRTAYDRVRAALGAVLEHRCVCDACNELSATLALLPEIHE